MNIIEKYLDKGLTGKKLNSIKGIVIHWFASPMAKAENVIKYWERQANGVAAHDVICLDGTLYRAIPYNQMAYHVGCPRGYTKEATARLSKYPNDSTVGIECAHVDMTGKMTDATYKTLVEHSAKLLKQFNLTVNDLWLHSEIVGKDYKDCHRWFTTTQPSAWIQFKKDVDQILNPVAPSPTQSVKGVVVEQPFWDGIEFKQNQIGRITIIKPINLWKRVEGKLELVRVLQPSETYRVYSYDEQFGGQYNLGGVYVTNMDGFVKYETPSRRLLEQAEEFYK